MIFTLPAPNIYEAQGRVAGHKHTPTSRHSLATLKQLVPRLKELKVERVICSDLDGQSGEYLARRLNVPYEEWESLRRFNAGKSHGIKASAWGSLLDTMNVMWNDKPDVPVKGGDSKTSFIKRMNASAQRLAAAKKVTLVVATPQVICAVLGRPEEPLTPLRVYQAEVPLGATTQTF